MRLSLERSFGWRWGERLSPWPSRQGFIWRTWGDAEGRALAMLKINFTHLTTLPEIEIKSPFSKNLKSSFCSKNFLPWNCELLEYIIKIICSCLKIFLMKKVRAQYFYRLIGLNIILQRILEKMSLYTLWLWDSD